jgi:hypothetical protein
MCSCCGEEEEDLEHVLRACPELESPRRRNFVQVPPPLSAFDGLGGGGTVLPGGLRVGPSVTVCRQHTHTHTSRTDEWMDGKKYGPIINGCIDGWEIIRPVFHGISMDFLKYR